MLTNNWCQVFKKTFGEMCVLLLSLAFSLLSPLPRRNLNYFSNAYAAAVSAVDPDAGNGELCIKVPSELWKHVDGKVSRTFDCTVRSWWIQ